jgi:hypothetical protein
VRKSKRIKELEIRVEALSIMTETLVGMVYNILDKNNNKSDLDAGKWYKEKP